RCRVARAGRRRTGALCAAWGWRRRPARTGRAAATGGADRGRQWRRLAGLAGPGLLAAAAAGAAGGTGVQARRAAAGLATAVVDAPDGSRRRPGQPVAAH